MSDPSHWLVVAITVLSLVGLGTLLIANRKGSGDETTGHEFDGIHELDTPLPPWWVGMFAASILFAVGYLIAYPGLGAASGVLDWTSRGEHDRDVAAYRHRFAPLYAELAELDADGLQNDARARQVGRRLFLNHCATCHGQQGEGAVGFPNLADDEWLGPDDFATVKRTILSGRTGVMPPWGAALGEDGVEATTQYVLSLAGLPNDGSLAAQGEQSYMTFCVACHGVDGTGNAALGAPDLTNDSWLFGGSADVIADIITNGLTTEMPGHADVLDEQQAHILAGYILGLSR